MSDPIIPAATERPFNVFVGPDKSPQFVAEPGVMVIQFRTDTPAFDGFPHEKESAIKLVIGQAQAALKDASRRNHEQGVATYPWHALNDSNGIQVGDVAHVDAARHWPALEASSSGVRIEFDMAALYRARSSDRFPWGQSLLAVVRYLEDTKHDVHKTVEVNYIDVRGDAPHPVVSSFKRTESPLSRSMNYLHAQDLSTPDILCANEFADKPSGVFVSVDPVQVVKAKALLRENPWLQEVVFHPLEHEIHADYTVDSEIHITRDQMNSSEMTLVLHGRFDGEVYNLKLHDGLKTELMALPEFDELEAHCSPKNTAVMEPG